ncbi:flippase-like domain-containing protein [Flavobacterium sp. CYK-4]|uniref:lysylphosphatidylglycerol synthase transmembrane domain-containing protein n=1 Tax=Flavobacterium lotistagni TaxID=2709660 RepID=UPI00140DA960|nr:lysylphosphatidylglycerol synthase transmembrane domain-containing protein [Flavobacterium lotistagni]NHM06580.1 flippase-like domain-containing protein [Flavobacterium lotistagni]
MREPELFSTTEPTAEAATGFLHHFKKWFSILLPVFVGLFLTLYTYNSFTEAQIEEIYSYFKNANYYYIYLAAFVAILGNISRAYRWKFPLEQMGYTCSFANNFMAVSIGYLWNLTVPKSGEISRALILKKYNGVPFDKGFGSIVAERIVDVLILLFFMILAVLLQFDLVQSFILQKIPLAKLLALGALTILLLVIAVLMYRYSKNRWILLIKEKIAGLQEGMMSILYMKKKGAYFFHTLFIWCSYILTFYLAIFVFPETSSLDADAVVTAFVVGSIAIAFTNSGFGSYPFLIAKILVFYSISETTGSAFGWIVWTSQMLLVLLLGLGSFILLPLLNRKK